MQNRDEDPQHWAEVDLALSSAAVRLLMHLHFGRIEPRFRRLDLEQPRPALDTAALLTKLASTEDIDGLLATVEPQFYHYRLLKEWLSRYRPLAADPALTNLPAFGRPFRSQPGETYSGAAALRKLLTTLGDGRLTDPAPRRTTSGWTQRWSKRSSAFRSAMASMPAACSEEKRSRR